MSDKSSDDEDLGGPRDATPEQMLHKAIERHPDKNHEDSPEVSNQKMQVLNEAHEILESPTKMVECDHTFKGDVGSGDGVGHPSEQETPLSPEGNVHPEEGEQSEEEVASGEDPPSVAPPSETVSRDDEVEDEEDLHQAMKETVSIPNMTTNEAGEEEDASVEEFLGTAPPSPIEPRDYKVGGPSDEVSKTPISVPRKEDENSLASKNSDNKSEINVLESPQPVGNQHIEDTTPSVSNPILEAMEQNVLDWDTLIRLARDQSALSQHMKDLHGQRSLLHVAVASGRYSLVRALLDMLIIGTNFNKAEALEFIVAIDPETRATALQMDDETNCIRSMRVYIKIVIDFLESSEISLDSFIAHHRQDYDLVPEPCIYLPESFSAVDCLFWRAAIEEVPAHIHGAMKQKDCARLGKLFSMHFNNRDSGWSQYMSDPYIKERPVLHVAAMYGCFPLVKQFSTTLPLVKSDNLTSGEERLESESKKQKALCFIRAIDPATGLTALQMADDIIGNRSISERIKHVLRFLESSSGGTLEDFETSTILFEAYPHTQWYKELKTYVDQDYQRRPDGAAVLSLLRENSRLILETFHGLSVMHLAMLHRDDWLFDSISHLFNPDDEIVWGDSYHPRAVSWSTMKEAKAHGEKEFSWEIFPNTHSDLLPYYGVSISEIDGTPGLPNQMRVYSRWVRREGDDEAYGTPRYYMPKWIIDEKWKVEEWQAGFEADVDFNFEVDSERKSQLRVHHACKDPLRFQEFLTSLSEGEHFKRFSTMMHDGKGRTLHHILLDHHTSDKLPGWAFFEIFSPEVSKYCIKHAQDSKGRFLKDILIGKNYIQHNIVLELFSYHNMNFERDVANEESYSRVLGNYYVACALWQYNIARLPTWVAALQAHLSKLRTMKLHLFATATSTNTTMFQEFLRPELGVHLMVKDKKVRTMLHYAADPTLFNGQTLLDMSSEYVRSMILECFSTVEDYYQFKMKAFSKTNMGFNIENQDLEMENEATIQSNVRRRATILMLLQAGLDLAQEDNDGKVPNLGPTSDANYQTWWYDLVVKDATDNKQSFNQAGNALSVVGTLVAATSYIGPLQPPMSYIDGGLVNHSKTLVDIFMVTNTLAFFLAMASVMFAVVPSLPMPRESIMSELKRARQMVLVSLCLLLVAIATIIISFSAASVVVNQYEHFFPQSNILFGPLLIGWSICLIAIASFFIRILRLSFYENAIVHMIYRFSLRGCCTRTWKLICTRIWKFCTRIWKFWTRTWDSYRAFFFRDFAKIFQPINVLIPEETELSTVPRVFVILCIILYVVLIFPIFLILHVLHVVILIPCKRLYVLCCAQFRLCRKPGVRVSRQS